MIETIKNNIFTTEGRLNRLKYIKFHVLWTIASVVISMVVGIIAGIISDSADSFFVYVVQSIISIPFVIGGIMINIRRLHDLDRSGWFLFIVIVPIIGVFLGLYMLLAKGTDGSNRYGEDPLSMIN